MNASNNDTKNFKKNYFQRTEKRIHSERKSIKRFLTTNENKSKSRIKRTICAISAWRWRKTSRLNVWTCIKN